jgi:hypothetical protein
MQFAPDISNRLRYKRPRMTAHYVVIEHYWQLARPKGRIATASNVE